MDTFHKSWILGLLALSVVGCVSCSGKNLSDKDLIEAVGEAGCHLKTVKRDVEADKIKQIDCHDTVRYVR